MRDLGAVFEALARSRFRSHFRLGPSDAAYLAAKGLPAVLSHAERFVEERLAPAEPPNDGSQTPMRGHPAFVAQHATASCCRSCLSKWHGITMGRPLTEAEKAHVVAGIARWLEAQPVPPEEPREPRLL
jgi:hypothetical protein